VTAVCAAAGFNGRTVTIRYDPDTLALVECEVAGDGPPVVAGASRDDGSQSAWSRRFDDPGTELISGLSFAGRTDDGDPFGLSFTMYQTSPPA